MSLLLVRRSMVRHSENCEPCAHCQRTLLAGEHMFICDDRIVCELCIGLEPEMPKQAQVLHGPELGNTIRILDKRPLDAAAPRPRRRRSSRAALRPPKD